VGVITPTLAIKRHKRGDRVYLAEYKQVREGKKVRSVFVRYLGPEDEVKAGRKPKGRVLDRLDMKRSHRAGDVRLLWALAQDLGLVEEMDGICCGISRIDGPSPGKYLTMWAINRALDPESCTQLERWVATTDLPLLAGVDPEVFDKDSFLGSLDFVCREDASTGGYVDHSASIDEALYRRWRQSHPLAGGETVAYDLTSVLFFGVTCPLGERGYNTNGSRRQQVNLAVLVSKVDRAPITHFVYNGSRNTSSTVKNLLARLKSTHLTPGTLIWDRANVSKAHVGNVEQAGWKLICGVPKTSKDARALVDGTDVPLRPDTYIRRTGAGHLYAVRAKGPLFGRKRSVVVYVNQERRARDLNERNNALAEIGKELDDLAERGKDWGEARLHTEIGKIAGKWDGYVSTRVKRKGDGARVEWRYRSRQMAQAERSYGTYLLLTTDESLTTEEAVKAYLEKDFVEKVFRMLKTTEELEPVRHRLENRVRAYMFVCMLAYRLLAALRFRIAEATGEDGSCERTSELLRDLRRVERVEVGFGKEVKTWYLNTTKAIEKMLKKIGMKNLLKEEVRLKV